MNWIETKASLPAAHRSVLCWNDIRDWGIPLIGYYTGSEWVVHGGVDDVTHWMPLPEPPEFVELKDYVKGAA